MLEPKGFGLAHVSRFAIAFALAALSSLSYAGNTTIPILHFTSANAQMVINSSAVLTSDLVAGNLTILPNLTIVTDGHEIYVAGTLIADDDSIITGKALSNFGGPANSISTSYGCSGGAGGGYSEIGAGEPGGRTLVSGGIWSGPGSCPTIPALNNTIIATWYLGGFQNYLEGASGGHGQIVDQCGACSNGGSSAFGIYIQAGRLILTNSVIYANSISDAGIGDRVGGGGGGGSGGAGRIILAYRNGYVTGTYNTVSGIPGAGTNGGGRGGFGGGGTNATAYHYFTAPIKIEGPNSTNKTRVGPCYPITGLSNGEWTSLYLSGSWFSIFVNSITQNSAELTIRNMTYYLYPNSTEALPAYGGYLYNVTFEGQPSPYIEICSSYILTSTTSTTSTTSISTSSSYYTSSIESVSGSSPPIGTGDLAILIFALLLIALAMIVSENEKRKRM